MARGNRPVEVRVDDATRDRWTVAARDAGQPLSAFIRDTVDAAITAPPVTQALIEMQKDDLAKPRRAAKKTQACERERFHRPGTFCKTCGKSW